MEQIKIVHPDTGVEAEVSPKLYAAVLAGEGYQVVGELPEELTQPPPEPPERQTGP